MRLSGATLATCTALVAAGCDYSLPDPTTPADAAMSTAPCASDAAASEPGCWVWLGGSSAGWTISNEEPSGGGYWDCCGSTSDCGVCVDNTRIESSPGSPPVTTFDSGPEEDGGTDHRYDGFTAWYRNVPVVEGRTHTLSIDIAGLAASIAGMPGTETSSNYWPTWGLDVYEGANRIGGLTATWGSAQCTTCPPAAGDLRVKPTSFTPSQSSVDLALWAHHRSSQIPTEVYGVQVGVTSIEVAVQ